MDISYTDIENYPLAEKEDDIQITPLLRPTLWDLRYTFSDQTSEHEYLKDTSILLRYKHIAKELKDKILNYTYGGKITGGMEVKNKVGENTRCHLHFRFMSTHPKETMVRPCKKLLNDRYDLSTTGNKVWYFKAQTEVDMNKFWRYPLKETLMPSLCSGYSLADLTEMAKIANANLQVAIQVNQKKMDNRNETDTLFSRVSEILVKENIREKCSICQRIIEFYVAENRPLNRQVITGYTLTHMVQQKLLKSSELAEDWFK